MHADDPMADSARVVHATHVELLPAAFCHEYVFAGHCVHGPAPDGPYAPLGHVWACNSAGRQYNRTVMVTTKSGVYPLPDLSLIIAVRSVVVGR